ncbi:hypothetical protein, partial [Bradyrhizobium sp. 137]|uniref:hypothetical protein n=1 Tax=Bradyrhizobium sp. 137 TaxID=2782614 RepID=UPI001FF9CF00
PSAAPSNSGATFRIDFCPIRNALQRTLTCDSPALKGRAGACGTRGASTKEFREIFARTD